LGRTTAPTDLPMPLATLHGQGGYARCRMKHDKSKNRIAFLFTLQNRAQSIEPAPFSVLRSAIAVSPKWRHFVNSDRCSSVAGQTNTRRRCVQTEVRMSGSPFHRFYPMVRELSCQAVVPQFEFPTWVQGFRPSASWPNQADLGIALVRRNACPTAARGK